MAASPARRCAKAALMDVEAGQSATAALHHHLSQMALSPRDRALATQMVYGVLRWQGQLDWIIDRAAAGGRHRPEGSVRQCLRIAAYELLHLRAVPPRATCHQAVELVRLDRRQAAGFVNALCRRMHALLQSPPQELWPDPQRDPEQYLSVRYSHPRWMVARWLSRFGFEETRALLEANNENPPLTVRVNRLKMEREALRRYWRERGIEASPTHLSEDGLVVSRAEGGVSQLPGFREGWFSVQDESSQLVARALAPQPGEHVLDMCSAPGGKTTHIAELMGDEGLVVASDIDPVRLQLVEENAQRLGLKSICIRRLSGAPSQGSDRHTFHRVLLDAPCTGLGVLRRRAEARWQKRPGDVAGLARLQANLLEEAVTWLKPGGILVYSTCSFEPEETELQMDAFLRAHPDFMFDSLEPHLPAGLIPHMGPSRATLTLLPHQHGTDGFFLARLRYTPR